MQTDLTIIGMEAAGVTALPQPLQDIISNANFILADSRFHDDLVKLAPDCIISPWPRPFTKIYDLIDFHRKQGHYSVILTTGDPQYFGAGSSIIKKFGMAGIEIHPARSGLSLAAAQLGLCLDKTECLSLHGRPITQLRSKLRPNQHYLLIPHDRNTPEAVAKLCVETGFEDANMILLSQLGDQQQRVSKSIKISDYDPKRDMPDDFHMIALHTNKAAISQAMARPPGIADDLFIHDGKMTKQDMRALAMLRLNPHPASIMWDLGCGAASVMIEYLLLAGHDAACYGVDNQAKRLEMAQQNIHHFGLERMATLIKGDSMDILDDLPDPDAIFIGGGISEALILTAYDRLLSGGSLLAHGVTMEAERCLLNIQQHFKNHDKTGAISSFARYNHASEDRLSPAFTAFRPQMTVTQFSLRKP
ncbi:MAG: precorrin-6y C5,15-methyltransferase (decarboxylating) subunit CbiE [Alphaproteobacteria bacterium]